eukprot:6949911-Pyramimonas_sp.AAC.1
MWSCKHCKRHWSKVWSPGSQAKADQAAADKKKKGANDGNKLVLADNVAPAGPLPSVATMSESEVQQLIGLARKSGNNQVAKQYELAYAATQPSLPDPPKVRADKA